MSFEDDLERSGSTFMIRALREFRAAELAGRIEILKGQRAAALAVVAAYQDHANTITAEIESAQKSLDALDAPVVAVTAAPQEPDTKAQEEPVESDKDPAPTPTPDPPPASSEASKPDAYVHTPTPDGPQPTSEVAKVPAAPTGKKKPEPAQEATALAHPKNKLCPICGSEQRPPNYHRHIGACAERWIGKADSENNAGDKLKPRIAELWKLTQDGDTNPPEEFVNTVASAMRKRIKAADAAKTAPGPSATLQEQADDAEAKRAAETGIPPGVPMTTAR
jgi:hypothetical protein